MKPPIQFAARLYPAAWRWRYGKEFEALLEDTGGTWSDFWDTARGAMSMQLRNWTFTKFACLFAVIGLLVGGAIAYSTAPQYVSFVILRTLSPAAVTRQSSRTSVATIVTKAATPREGIRTLRAITAHAREMNVPILEIRGDGASYGGLRIAFMSDNRSTDQRAAALLASDKLRDFQILSPASLPGHLYPVRALWIAAGGLGGLLLGAVCYLVLRRRTTPAAG